MCTHSSSHRRYVTILIDTPAHTNREQEQDGDSGELVGKTSGQMAISGEGGEEGVGVEF